VEQQPEGIGSEAMAAESVSNESILELFNAVLAFSTIIVEGKNRTATTLQVRHEEPQVSASIGMFGLVAYATPMGPTLAAMQKARKGALRFMGPTITSRQLESETIGSALEQRVVGPANSVLDAEKLAEFIEQRQAKPSIRSQSNPDLGKFLLQSWDDAQKQGDDASLAGSGAGPQASSKKTTGVSFEDQQRVIHVLAITAVEEAQLLLPVRRIVRRVYIQQNFAAPADLFATGGYKPIEQDIL
jgi:hypothetical protein